MLAEILGSSVDAQAVNGGPQVELGSGRVAAEAAVAMTAEMDREDPALRRGVSVDRTRAAQTRTLARRGHEVQQAQHLLDSDVAANLLQIDSRHGSPGRIKSVGVGLRANREEAQVLTPLVWEAASRLWRPCEVRERVA